MTTGAHQKSQPDGIKDRAAFRHRKMFGDIFFRHKMIDEPAHKKTSQDRPKHHGRVIKKSLPETNQRDKSKGRTKQKDCKQENPKKTVLIPDLL